MPARLALPLLLVALAAACAAPSTTTVYVVRHAEKAADPGDGDPELTAVGHARAAELARVLGDVPIQAVYTTKYRRNRSTAAPIAAARGLAPVLYDAHDAAGFVARLRSEHPSGRVVVVGHSNTIPELLAAFGADTPVTIASRDYDDLFVVVLEPGGARADRLHYGAVSTSTSTAAQ